jgi:hypothetical protein
MSATEFRVSNEINLLKDKIFSKQVTHEQYSSELRTATLRREQKSKHNYYMNIEKRLENAYIVIAALCFVIVMLVIHEVPHEKQIQTASSASARNTR